MFDDMAEEDILSEEKKEREEKLRIEEEDILIGDTPKTK